MLTAPKFGWNARMAGVPAAEIDPIVADALPDGFAAPLAAAGIATIEAPSGGGRTAT
jgi:hypothetical protein